MKKKLLKAPTLDRRFDRGEEIIDQLDLKGARRVGKNSKRPAVSPKIGEVKK